MQPADIAVELRPRTAWEAIDLGLAMLQRWRGAVFVPHAIVLGIVTAVSAAIALMFDKAWIALVLVWWMKPLYDRVVLYVLSHAVFGEQLGTPAVLAAWREWLGNGLLRYLVLRLWPDLARSFNLPVRQLEGSRGRAGRERRSLLGRRTRGSAVWFTVVCMHFELILYWSLQLVATMLVPAKAYEGRNFLEALSGDAWGWAHVAAYAGAVLILEPFYVAGGFALYLNRRTLLEGWDLEVALRRLAERHAALAASVVLGFAFLLHPPPTRAEKDPKREIAEVLKAPEFGHEVDAMRWMPRRRPAASNMKLPDFRLGAWVAEAARIVLWTAVAAAVAFLLWRFWRSLPRLASQVQESHRPPQALFGLDLAPQSLPEDVAATASALAQEGKLREALALLYRASLSRLVHRKGVRLLSSHTEAEVLRLSPSEASPYLERLTEAWRSCAYAHRAPGVSAVEALAEGYRAL